MTYQSNLNLSIGQIPDVDDPSVYEALLLIHNAIDGILNVTEAITAKEYAISSILITDYAIQSTDNVILTDATAGNINIDLPDLTDVVEGSRFTVKQVAGANTTVVSTLDGALIDGAASLNIALLASKTLTNDGIDWWIIG